MRHVAPAVAFERSPRGIPYRYMVWCLILFGPYSIPIPLTLVLDPQIIQVNYISLGDLLKQLAIDLDSDDRSHIEALEALVLLVMLGLSQLA